MLGHPEACLWKSKGWESADYNHSSQPMRIHMPQLRSPYGSKIALWASRTGKTMEDPCELPRNGGVVMGAQHEWGFLVFFFSFFFVGASWRPQPGRILSVTPGATPFSTGWNAVAGIWRKTHRKRTSRCRL